MTTLGDAILAALNANWNVGTGGTEPSYYNSEDYGSLEGRIPDTDYIVMLQQSYTRKTTRLNDDYVSHIDRIDFIVSTQNDSNKEQRLDTLVAEVRRLINPTNVTGYHEVDIINEDRRISELYTYRAMMTVEAVVKSTASAVTPGSTTTSSITVDELTVNTSADMSTASVHLGTLTLEGGTVTLNAILTFDGYNVGFDTDAGFSVGGLTVTYTDTATHMASAGPINLKASGDSDDYLQISTTSNEVKIDGVGGDLTLDSDTSGEITLAKLYDLLMYESANAEWVSCAFEVGQPVGKYALSSATERTITNVDATDFTLHYTLPYPPTLGSLKLYISGVRVGLADADATDYVDTTQLKGVDSTSQTALDTNTTNLTSSGDNEDTFTAVDCSAHDRIGITLYVVSGTADEFDISYVSVRMYYA
jgi:hypothetical protein